MIMLPCITVQVERIEGLTGSGPLRAKLGPEAEGTLLTVHGTGIDLSPDWRHAGAGYPCPLLQ